MSNLGSRSSLILLRYVTNEWSVNVFILRTPLTPITLQNTFSLCELCTTLNGKGGNSGPFNKICGQLDESVQANTSYTKVADL